MTGPLSQSSTVLTSGLVRVYPTGFQLIFGSSPISLHRVRSLDTSPPPVPLEEKEHPQPSPWGAVSPVVHPGVVPAKPYSRLRAYGGPYTVESLRGTRTRYHCDGVPQVYDLRTWKMYALQICYYLGFGRHPLGTLLLSGPNVAFVEADLEPVPRAQGSQTRGTPPVTEDTKRQLHVVRRPLRDTVDGGREPVRPGGRDSERPGSATRRHTGGVEWTSVRGT